MAETNKEANQAEAAPQPGAVITPGGESPKPADTPAPQVSPQAPEPKQPEPPQEIPAEPQLAQDYGSDNPDSINWTASEFVAHDKSASWYTLLAVGAAIGAALIYLITKDFISVAVVVVAALLLATYGAHKPRQLEYRLDNHGIGIGPKSYTYTEFRSFSVLPEGAFSSIIFMPLKRFSPPITIYYAPEDEDKILDILSQQLPFEQHRRDAVDSLMRRIRF